MLTNYMQIFTNQINIIEKKNMNFIFAIASQMDRNKFYNPIVSLFLITKKISNMFVYALRFFSVFAIYFMKTESRISSKVIILYSTIKLIFRVYFFYKLICFSERSFSFNHHSHYIQKIPKKKFGFQLMILVFYYTNSYTQHLYMLLCIKFSKGIFL